MAAPTWTEDSGPLKLWAKGVATSGTATDMPTGAVGLYCGNVSAYDVFLHADAGQTLSGAGALECWDYDEQNALWARAAEFDLAVAAAWKTGARSVSFAGLSAGRGSPVIGRSGRRAYVPNGVTVSGGGTTVQMNGTPGRSV